MKLLFKQRFFTLLDNYYIYDEAGEIAYKVEGQIAWGHCLKIYDRSDREVGMIKQRLLTFTPQFEMYAGGSYLGCITREFTFFKPKYNIDCNGWRVEGDFFELDYTILGSAGQTVATVSKELMNWTDTYSINVRDPKDALCALMLVLAIDIEKCSRKD